MYKPHTLRHTAEVTRMIHPSLTSLLIRPLLLMMALMLGACASPGPMGTPTFDPSYRRTLEQGEVLLFSASAVLVAGTYMEGEVASYPSYQGALLLTDRRLLFAQWDGKQKRYEPLIWTAYADFARVKRHNTALLRYVAMTATDGNKFAYMLSKDDVEPAYETLLARIAALSVHR